MLIAMSHNLKTGMNIFEKNVNIGIKMEIVNYAKVSKR
jgi:hypothetical protein